ncbi:MAG: hypothetical protein HXS44_01535 [Theionarchaea archaeon]|nr:hypothetical protein [Theionarchaea archaeon]
MKPSIRGKKSEKSTELLLIAVSVMLFLVILETFHEGIIPDARLGTCLLCDTNGEGVLREPNEAPPMCSVFSASSGEKVFLGANLDYLPQDYFGNPPSLFIFPAQEEENEPSIGHSAGYGFVAFGFLLSEGKSKCESYLGGMNEKGLAFGTSGLPRAPLNPHPERPYSISSEFFHLKAMRKCSDITCVIELANKFNWGDSSSMLGQHHFTDSAGDAVVISAGKDGELAFTRKKKGDSFLVSTNFNLANPDNGKYPCWRYDTAVALLEVEKDFSLPFLASILDAIHVEGESVNTICSYIFDLRTGDIYVSHFHQFEEIYKTNLSDELTNSRGSWCSVKHLRELFSQETRNRAFSEFQKYKERYFARITLKIASYIAVLLGCCLIIYKVAGNLRKEGSIECRKEEK